MFIAILFCSKPHSRFQHVGFKFNKESEIVEARLFTSSVCLMTKSSRSVLSYRTGCT